MNRRQDENFIMEKLDRAFATMEWINTHPHYVLQNQPILRSIIGQSFWTLISSNYFVGDLLDLKKCGLPILAVKTLFKMLGK